MLQAVLHRILQPLAFEIVIHLVGGGLTHIEHRFPRHMLRFDLLTHGPPPAPHRRARFDLETEQSGQQPDRLVLDVRRQRLKPRTWRRRMKEARLRESRAV